MDSQKNNMPLLRYRRVVGVSMAGVPSHSEEPDFFSFLWFVLKVGIKGALIKTAILGVVLTLTSFLMGGESPGVSKFEALGFIFISVFFFTLFSVNSVKTFLHPVIAKERLLGTQHLLLEGHSVARSGPMKPHLLRFYPAVWFNVLNANGMVKNMELLEVDGKKTWNIQIGDNWIYDVSLSDDMIGNLKQAILQRSRVDVYLYRARAPFRLLKGVIVDLIKPDKKHLVSGSHLHMLEIEGQGVFYDDRRPETVDAVKTVSVIGLAYVALAVAGNVISPYVDALPIFAQYAIDIALVLTGVFIALYAMYYLDLRFGVKNLSKTTRLIRINKQKLARELDLEK